MMLNVLPGMSKEDMRYCRFSYSKLRSQSAKRFSVSTAFPNCNNVMFSQIRHAIRLALRGRAVFCSIVDVLLGSTPLEVQNMVVCSVAVEMPALHSRWFRPYKGSEYQSMDGHVLPFSIIEKMNVMVSFWGNCREFLLSAAPYNAWLRSCYIAVSRQNGAALVNRVKRKSRYYAKTIWNRIVDRHAWTSFVQVVLRSLSRFTRLGRFRLFSVAIIAKDDASAMFVDMENRLSYIFVLTLPHRQISKEGRAARSHAPLLLNGCW